MNPEFQLLDSSRETYHFNGHSFLRSRRWIGTISLVNVDSSLTAVSLLITVFGECTEYISACRPYHHWSKSAINSGIINIINQKCSFVRVFVGGFKRLALINGKRWSIDFCTKIWVSVLARLITRVQLSAVQLITFYGLFKMAHPQIIGCVKKALCDVRGVI